MSKTWDLWDSFKGTNICIIGFPEIEIREKKNYCLKKYRLEHLQSKEGDIYQDSGKSKSSKQNKPEQKMTKTNYN